MNTPLSQQDYQDYLYHKNVISILQRCKSQNDTFIQNQLTNSRTIINRVEQQIWGLQPTDNSQTVTSAQKLSRITITGLKTFDEILSIINLERVYLGIVRNIFTFSTMFTIYMPFSHQINEDSTLLASYIYPIRGLFLLMRLPIIIWNNKEYNDHSAWFKENMKKLRNDLFWTVLLGLVTLSFYLTGADFQLFFENELTRLFTDALLTCGLLFDYWNEGTPNRQLDRDWKKLEKLLDGNSVKEDLKKCYLAEREYRNIKVMEAASLFLLFSTYEAINIVHYGLSLNHLLSPTLEILFPWLSFAFSLIMVFARIYFIFYERFSPGFENLTTEEQQHKLQEMWFKLIKDLAKFVILALVIFVIGSQLHLTGVPSLIALGLVTAGMMLLSNLLIELIKNFTPKKWFTDDSANVTSPATIPAEHP